jgi:hypothetical protein
MNNELEKVGHKIDGTVALGYVRLEMEVDTGGRRPPQTGAAVILSSPFQRRGTAVAQWLRRCATYRKATGSILEEKNSDNNTNIRSR